MIDFGALSVKEATAYAQAYAEGAPMRAAWLPGEVAATGGDPACTAGVDGLPDLWAWFVGRVQTAGATNLVLATPMPTADPQAGDRAPWHTGKPNPYMSDGLLWLIDALGCHLAGLVTAVLPDARWDVYRSKARNDIDQKRTKLVGVDSAKGHADPSRMVYGKVIGHTARDEALPEDALTELYDYMVYMVAADPPAAPVEPDTSGAPGSPATVPPLAGPVPQLPQDLDGYRSRLTAAGRWQLAQELAGTDDFGIVPGGQPADSDPRPGERWIALYDEVRGLVGDPVIAGLAGRLRGLDGVVSTDHRRREYVEVIGTLTDDQLRAAVIADLALHADLTAE